MECSFRFQPQQVILILRVWKVTFNEKIPEKDPIFAFYEENGTLTEKRRRALVTTAVSFLVEKKWL